MANFTRGRALGAVLTATLVAAAAPGLSSSADALAGINGRVANPTVKVTLDLDADVHVRRPQLHHRPGAGDGQALDLIAGMPIAFGSYSNQMRTVNPNLTLIAYSNGTILGTSKAARVPRVGVRARRDRRAHHAAQASTPTSMEPSNSGVEGRRQPDVTTSVPPRAVTTAASSTT